MKSKEALGKQTKEKLTIQAPLVLEHLGTDASMKYMRAYRAFKLTVMLSLKSRKSFYL